MEETIFDKIVRGDMKSWIVWQDEEFMAFLTPFPNTPGVTVVIPKVNLGDYVFRLDDDMYRKFLAATKTVANILEKAFNTARVALVFEGIEIPYVHARLYPLQEGVASRTIFIDGAKMDDEKLDEIQAQIIASQK